MISSNQTKVHQLFLKMKTIDTKGNAASKAKFVQNQLLTSQAQFIHQLSYLKDKLFKVQNAYQQIITNQSLNKKAMQEKIKFFRQGIKKILQNSEKHALSTQQNLRNILKKCHQQMKLSLIKKQKTYVLNVVQQIQEQVNQQFQLIKRSIAQIKKNIKEKHIQYIERYNKIDEKLTKKCIQLKQQINIDIQDMDKTQAELNKICQKMKEQIFEEFSIEKQAKQKKRNQIHQKILDLIKDVRIDQQLN